MSLKLTNRKLVGFGRFLHSQGHLTLEDEKHIQEAIDYMELTDVQDEDLDELSGGLTATRIMMEDIANAIK